MTRRPAIQKDYELMNRLDRAGIEVTCQQANTLRRAELTLGRWGERECGDGSNWYVERDEKTGLTYNVHVDSGRRYRCPDMETGALDRVAALCKELGLHYYYQTDPRGCSLYVSREPMTQANYSSVGVACHVGD